MNAAAKVREMLAAGLTPVQIRDELSFAYSKDAVRKALVRNGLGGMREKKAPLPVEPLRCHPQPKWTADISGARPLPTCRLIIHPRRTHDFGDPKPGQSALDKRQAEAWPL